MAFSHPTLPDAMFIHSQQPHQPFILQEPFIIESLDQRDIQLIIFFSYV